MTNDALVEKLTQALEADHVAIIDESHMHAGHVAMVGNPHQSGTHLNITVVSKKFEGVALIDCHRMVHDILKEDFQGALHAIQLTTRTPAEWSH